MPKLCRIGSSQQQIIYRKLPSIRARKWSNVLVKQLRQYGPIGPPSFRGIRLKEGQSATLVRSIGEATVARGGKSPAPARG